MLIWLFTFFLFIMMIVLATVGLWLNKRTLSGSCGGLNKLGLQKKCPICGVNAAQTQKKKLNQTLFKEIND